MVKYLHRVPYQDLQHSTLPGTFHLNRGSDLGITILRDGTHNVIISVQSGETEEEKVIGEVVSESELEELVPE